jgi:hypothetical protein
MDGKITHIHVDEEGTHVVTEIPVVDLKVIVKHRYDNDQPCPRGTAWTCREWPDCECQW